MTQEELASMIQRFGPGALKALGFVTGKASPMGMATMSDGRPDNSVANVDALQSAYAAARAQNRTPAGRVARGWDQFGPQGPAPAPMLPTPPTPAPVDMSTPPPAPPPALSAAAVAPQVPMPPGGPQGVSSPPAAAQAPATPVASVVPLPQPRPDVPTQDPMGFFQRNSAMMRDPVSGSLIDPVNADRAQASGPDVINKLMSYFHNKDVPSD